MQPAGSDDDDGANVQRDKFDGEAVHAVPSSADITFIKCDVLARNVPEIGEPRAKRGPKMWQDSGAVAQDADMNLAGVRGGLLRAYRRPSEESACQGREERPSVHHSIT